MLLKQSDLEKMQNFKKSLFTNVTPDLDNNALSISPEDEMFKSPYQQLSLLIPESSLDFNGPDLLIKDSEALHNWLLHKPFYKAHLIPFTFRNEKWFELKDGYSYEYYVKK